MDIMDACPLLELPDELLAMVIAALARLRCEDPGAMFRAARTCRRLHRAALALICYVSPSSIGALGPGLVLEDGGRGVRQTKDTSAFALASPVLRSGTATATFKLDFEDDIVVGLFPADQELDSAINSADGKRCALWVGAGWGGCARVVCDGEQSDAIDNIGLQPGDEVEVRVAFEDATTARVTFHTSSRADLAALGRTLKGVPACGLRFGVGFMFYEGNSVTLVARATA